MAKEKKINYWHIILLGVFALLFQTYFVPHIEIVVWRPDIILMVVLYSGNRYGVLAGTLSGFFLGLLQDTLSLTPIGISSLANSICGFLAGQTKQIKLTANMSSLIALILILLHGLVFYFFYQFKSETTFLNLIFSRVFPNTIYTFFLGIIFYFLIKPRHQGTS
jgi:rod shape-determining protein MreD